MDKRVCFDFEIEFSNGGGIQGQGFRLDIDGDDIKDDDLADYIIGDMNLLMVGKTRILNKEIIEEPHKRNKSQTETADQAGIIVDLSHSMTATGELKANQMGLASITGTYLSTSHGSSQKKIELETVSGLQGVVIRVSGMEERAIDWTHFAASSVSGKAVLVETGWRKFQDSDKYLENHPFLTEAAASYLQKKGAALVGIDSLSLDDTHLETQPARALLLESNIPIVMHLKNLEQLPNSGFKFYAVPSKIQNTGSSPVWAHARLSHKKT